MSKKSRAERAERERLDPGGHHDDHDEDQDLAEDPTRVCTQGGEHEMVKVQGHWYCRKCNKPQPKLEEPK